MANTRASNSPVLGEQVITKKGFFGAENNPCYESGFYRKREGGTKTELGITRNRERRYGSDTRLLNYKLVTSDEFLVYTPLETPVYQAPETKNNHLR